MTKKVLILSGAFYSNVVDMFKEFGYANVPPANAPHEDIDAVVFTGGGDLSPSLYGESVVPGTYFNDRHDSYEIAQANKYWDIPKIGICRGGQLLNVLNGGSMYQHVDNHHSFHDATYVPTGQKVRLSSIHHQMMIPRGKFDLLLTAKQSTYRIRAGGREDEVKTPDIEAVFYPETKSLCWQPHPETEGDAGRKFFFQVVHDTLGI